MEKFYVVVLPTDKEGKVNRQMYEFDNIESAKQAFHSNCGKYFKAETLSECSVSVLNRTGNSIMSDTWKAEAVIAEPTEATE